MTVHKEDLGKLGAAHEVWSVPTGWLNWRQMEIVKSMAYVYACEASVSKLFLSSRPFFAGISNFFTHAIFEQETSQARNTCEGQ
jgi:hypothetical protein